MTDDLTQVSEASDIADYIEFRVGSAKDPNRQLSAYSEALPLILSPRSNNGNSELLQSDEVEKIVSAASTESIEMVELTLEDAERSNGVIKRLRDQDLQLTISHYDYNETPPKSELMKIISNCREYGDLVKIAIFAEKEEDALLLLECLNDASRQGTEIAGYALGEVGRHTRVISSFYGSKLAYAPIRSTPESGTISLKQLADLLDTVANAEDIELMDGLQGNF